MKKTETGPHASFLSVFLSRRQGHASFLKSKFRSLLPSHPGAEVFVTVMDPRGTTAKRAATFLPHLSASNYGPENVWVLLTDQAVSGPDGSEEFPLDGRTSPSVAR